MEGLLILFVVLTLAVGLGTAFLFLTKNAKVQKVLFYFVAFLGMLIGGLSATSLPSNYVGQMIIAWVIGFLSIIGIVLWVKKYETVAKWMVAASAILGLVQLFFF